MAVSLTLAQLAVALRIIADATQAIPAGVQATLQTTLTAATAMVEEHAPNAPVAVQNEAVIRLASRLYDRSGAEARGTSPMVASGAAALLSQWRSRTSRAVPSATGSAASSAVGGPGVDQVARDAAAEAGRTAAAAGRAAGAAQDAADANTGFLATFAERVRTIVEALVPAWARAPNPPAAAGLADGSVTTAKLADDAVTQAKVADDAIGPRELAADSVRTGHLADNAVESAKIPSDAILSRHIAADQVTRGEMAAASVGSTELVDGGVSEGKLSGGVRTKLNARATSEDQTARDAATAAQTAAEGAQTAAEGAATAAAAARLEADTVFRVGPPFIHNEAGPRNLNIHLRHPLNAYQTARIMTVAVGNQPAVIVGYDHTVLEQWVNAEVSALLFNNIWSATVSTGEAPRPQLYPVGSYIPVEIRLLTGRGGQTVFRRVLDVLVEAEPEDSGAETLTQLGTFNPTGSTGVQLPETLETAIDTAYAGAIAFVFREAKAAAGFDGPMYREFRIFKPAGTSIPSGRSSLMASNAAGWTMDSHGNRINVNPPSGVSWLGGTVTVFSVTV